MTTEASVFQINASDGGVPKSAVHEAVVTASGLVGDRQADTVHHGSPHQALCLYSLEIIEALRAEGHPIGPGSAGENLTFTGLDWSALRRGVRIKVGDEVEIEVTDPTTPCSKNAAWFVGRDFRRISEELHPGWSRWYAKVIEGGTVRTGDPVALT